MKFEKTTYVFGLCSKANILAEKGKPALAMKYINEAIKIDSKNIMAWDDKLNLLIDLKRYKEALKIYDKLYEITKINDFLETKKEFLELLPEIIKEDKKSLKIT